MLFRSLFFAVLLSFACLLGTANASTLSCSVSGEHIGWLEASLNDWHRVKRQALKLRDSPRPLMILFDEKCSVSLEPGKSLRAMRAEPHKGIVALPGSRSVPAQLITFAATYEVQGGNFRSSFSPCRPFGKRPRTWPMNPMWTL